MGTIFICDRCDTKQGHGWPKTVIRNESSNVPERRVDLCVPCGMQLIEVFDKWLKKE